VSPRIVLKKEAPLGPGKSADIRFRYASQNFLDILIFFIRIHQS